MKKQTLTKLAMALTASVGIILLGGCDTAQNSGELGNFFGQLAAQTGGSDSQAYGILAQQTQNVANQQRQDEANRAYAKQQQAVANQQFYGNGAYYFNDSTYGPTMVVTCNSGQSCNPSQFDASLFTGIKTTFTTREDVAVWTCGSGSYSNWGYYLMNENGFVVRKFDPNANTASWQNWKIIFSPANNNGLPAGRYNFRLYNGSTYIKRVDFTVVDN